MKKLLLVNESGVHQAELNEVIQALEKRFIEIINKNLPSSNKEREDFIKSDDVCEMLHISKPTLNSWVKQGIIVAYKIESRVFYRRSEIIRVLEESVK